MHCRSTCMKMHVSGTDMNSHFSLCKTSAAKVSWETFFVRPWARLRPVCENCSTNFRFAKPPQCCIWQATISELASWDKKQAKRESKMQVYDLMPQSCSNTPDDIPKPFTTKSLVCCSWSHKHRQNTQHSRDPLLSTTPRKQISH